MSIFYPDLYLPSAMGITPALLAKWGIRGLILDVDNTLTTHDNPTPNSEVLRWLEEMRAAHIEMIILSNNNPRRVKPFAEILGMGFTANAAKPLTRGFKRAAAELGMTKQEVAVVGDQIFTDILGGNLYGAKTILVAPIEPEKTWFFQVKRRLERGILKNYEKSRRQKE